MAFAIFAGDNFMSDHSSTISEHIKTIGQVASGGAATATGTYAGFNVAGATAYASLAAAVVTVIYFVVSTGYALWKWRKEAVNGTAK
jgi:membrane protein DedA with SNARE-associated domain